jgi:RHS repeat-associated protein
LITEARDHLGRAVTYEYDAELRLHKVTDPLTGVTEYTYDAAHNLTTIKDARGIVYLKNEYTGARVTRQVLADRTKDALDPTNTRAYQLAYTVNGQGWPTQVDVTDPRGIAQRITTQPGGYLLTDTRAVGLPEQQTTTYERHPTTNLITARVDPLQVGGQSRRTEYTYNGKGDRLTVTQLAGTPEAVTTTSTYEDLAAQPVISLLKTVARPTLPATTYSYNAQGALTDIADPLGHPVTITPNAKGQPTAIATHSSPTQTETTQFGYDALGDLVTITDPLNRTTTRFVDDAGRLLAVTDPSGRRTRYEYDALNRLTKVTDPRGGTTQFQYDPNGNLRFLTDARNKVTEYTYDTADRVATRKDPLLRQESYQYDGLDNLTERTDRQGQVATFTYDALQCRTVARFSAAGPVTSLSYDAAHRLTQVQHSADGTTNVHTVTRVYDGLDRLTQETQQTPTHQRALAYGYDPASRRTSVNFLPAGPLTSLTYDTASRLTRVQRGVEVVTVDYDDANRRTAVTLPSGIRVESSYDAASQLTGLDYRQGVGGPLLGNLTYTYDRAGQRTKVGGTWARTGLPAAVASATYDDANQQLTLGGTTLTYDANGNLQTLADASGTTTYTWNAKNELTALSRPGLTASFEYDGLGRRTKKVVGGTTTEFLYDGLNPVRELNGSAVLATALAGLGLDELFRRTDAAGARDLLTDALGSTLALADGAGAVQTEYTYEPFGTTMATGQTSTNTLKYTGREDDGTGLYYYRARYYHPGLSRFISEDPIEFDGGDVNLYAYAGNSPVRWRDPFGQQLAVPAPVPIPVPLPPVFIPGTPENQAFVEATLRGLEALQNLMGRRQRETGLENVPDDEIARQARNPNLTPEERERYRREEKNRGLRNKQKERGGPTRPRGFLPIGPEEPLGGSEPPCLAGRKC